MEGGAMFHFLSEATLLNGKKLEKAHVKTASIGILVHFHGDYVFPGPKSEKIKKLRDLAKEYCQRLTVEDGDGDILINIDEFCKEWEQIDLTPVYTAVKGCVSMLVESYKSQKYYSDEEKNIIMSDLRNYILMLEVILPKADFDAFRAQQEIAMPQHCFYASNSTLCKRRKTRSPE